MALIFYYVKECKNPIENEVMFIFLKIDHLIFGKRNKLWKRIILLMHIFHKNTLEHDDLSFKDLMF